MNIFLGQGLSNLNTDGVKLGDFGFAVDVNSSNLLVETFKVGTSLYMAPEMAEKC